MRLRLEAAKHSATQLAKELGVDVSTIKNYLDRPIERRTK
jgi:DNA-binding MarR family transcriptional regulator